MHDETVRSISYEGFRYFYRVVTHPAPVTEPVFFVGGMFQDVHSWMRLESRVEKYATVVIVDLPGSGSADQLPGSYGFDFLAAALERVADDVEAPKINLLGVCYGAQVAYSFAQSRPSRVARLLLGGAADRVSDEEEAYVRNLLEGLSGTTADFVSRSVNMPAPGGMGPLMREVERVLEVIRRTDGYSIDPEHCVNGARRLIEEKLPASAPLSRVRTLVLAGEHDEMIPPSSSREVASRIAGSRFVVVSDCGHMVSLEREEEFADLVMRFCTDLPIDDLPYTTGLECFPPARS
jgi:pimeloyl-ACP methyl ester carboxylesterase